jgi:regulation of enolase protein 1 (concanavalin A-like superfamily)
MCRKFIYSVSFILLLAVSTKVQAVMFSDEFEAPHDYITNGVEGTGWDGFLGLNPGETVDALNTSIDRAGQLFMESTGAFYHEPWDPLGPFLYKIIEGDFTATVKVSDYAGTPDAVVYHNNCGLLARANPDDAGPGEDWVAIDYFPIWSCGNFVRTADNGVRTENGHNGAQWDLDPYLQLERKGNTFHFRTSSDGVNWIEMGVSPITRDDLDGLPLQVGLYQATYSGDPGYVAFDDFRVGPRMKAYNPAPVDGAIHPETWANLSWSPGGFAVSHDVYFSDHFEDVDAGIPDAFRGNQDSPYFVVGFPGFPYPEGLVPGTTYYWRIDEVNDADPNSPWKGKVWSFMVPPKTAYYPEPVDGTEFVNLDVVLSWTAGFGAKLHTIYFGEDYDVVNDAAGGAPTGFTSYTPGTLKFAKTYYWRVDELDGTETHKGDVWSFTTLGAVSGPYPSDGAVDVKPSVVLGWNAGAVAASHEVYFGTDADAVANATTAMPEFEGTKALGEENYDPGKLLFNTTYYWRIDEVNSVNPDSPWAGKVWSFTTGDFFVIDDFEDYDAGENQIWYAWHDGLGYGAPGTDPYYAGNGTGAAVGDETSTSYTEETIVHGGGKSMPVNYDNNKQSYAYYSEVEYTLTNQRDWTEQGVTELSLWFRGYPASVGSFVEGPVGTFTITGSGADIWDLSGLGEGYHDEFHFAYKTLSGSGSIVAKVESVENTNAWAKAGVMIRDTLNGDSKHAMMVVTPASGVSFQRRPETGGASAADTTAGITAPYWVKIERTLAGNFIAYSSANGSTWQMLGAAEPIQMGSNVYIGLAVTAHSAGAICRAVFSNVTTTGSVGAQWANQDIGILSNDAEPLYVALANNAGNPVVVVHDDPDAALIGTWTEWVIPLQTFADQGINLTDVDKIAIGLGTRGNMTTPGGAGKMFIDDIRLYRQSIQFPDYLPLDPVRYGVKTFEWTFGQSGQYTSEIIGTETVPYKSGPITGVKIGNVSDGYDAIGYNDGVNVKYLGAGDYYFSADDSLTGHPSAWSFGTLEHGMIIDQGVFYKVKTDLSTWETENDQMIVIDIQDVTVLNGNYKNAVIMWDLDTNMEFTPLDFHGRESTLGITLPIISDTDGYSVTGFDIYGHGVGPIAGGDIDALTGSLIDMRELKEIAPIL